MHPRSFTFDPDDIARAQLITLRAPKLDVLLPESRAVMPGIAHFLESGFKARDREGRLLLPNLRALSNSTVGVFSDYSGESTGQYFTYSFLVCAFGSLGPFKERMAALRISTGIGHKEIAFKDLGMGQIRRLMPQYLRLTNNYISGLVFTLVVDKGIPSLFGPGDRETQRIVADALEKRGYGSVRPKVAEKLFRVVHIIAFLLALLGHEGQKIFWMTDNDSIAESSDKHYKLLGVLNDVLPLYTTKSFGLLGGARPFQPRSFDYLDLLSVPDIAAGALAQCISSTSALGHESARIKDGGDHILRWLCYDSFALKKFSMIIKRDTKGDVGFGTINLEARAPIADEVFIPMELMR